MPAITLGLVEIEERLHALRRRLNSLTALHAAFLSLSVICLVAAALVALGRRGDAAAFRTAAWSGAVLAASAVAAAVNTARHRWLDVRAVAELADRRGELQDRLTTLVDLRQRPRPSRVAPLLIAQTLALGDSWRPQRITPRRVPRSVFLALLSAIALTASPLVAPDPPPPRQPEQAPPQMGESPNALQDLAVPAAVPPSGAGHPAPDAAGGDGSAPAGEAAAPQTLADAPQPAAPPGAAAPVGLAASVPDRAGGTDKSTGHAEQSDRGHDRGDAATGQATGTKEHAPGTAGDRAGAAGAPADGRVGQRAGATGTTGASGPEGDAGARAHQQAGDSQRAAQPPAAPDASGDGSRSGSAPGAGTGSHPDNLLAGGIAAGDPGHGGSATFKLTITSFLHAIDEHNAPPNRPDKRRGGPAAAPGSGEPVPALNDQQLRDDVLRKAEIPAEYEDIVRRVYSMRTNPE